jgi:ACS family hexuronate transporter-like MFS transporter
MLLSATMLNYMDRQTLSLTIKRIQDESHMIKEQYGNMELGFGIAFALGGLLAGFIVDRLSARYLYPIVLIGWSLAGIATAQVPLPIGTFVLKAISGLLGGEPGSTNGWLDGLIEQVLQRAPGQSDVDYAMYVGLFTCRTVLGFFEAGHWPCALIVTRRILTQSERSFGNSLLQSGAAIGAILTPIIAYLLVVDEPGGWKPPFIVIGLLGMTWIVPWLFLVRKEDLTLHAEPESAKSDRELDQVLERRGSEFWRRFAALMVVVVMINMTWQFFRAWLPLFLIEQHKYDEHTFVFAFTMLYYVAADVGCITSGYVGRQLANRGWSVHSARMTTFTVCAFLTMLSLLVPALAKGPLLLLVLLIIGAGALGLFPNYYSFTQELSARHQGKITGILGALTWIITSIMQKYVGRSIDTSHSYAFGLQLAGIVPLFALTALVLLWPRRPIKLT